MDADVIPTTGGFSKPFFSTEEETTPADHFGTTEPMRASSGVFFTSTFGFSVVLVIFNITALLLNGLVVFIVARYSDMRNTVTLCFANLAITDILLVLFSMSSSLRRTTGIDILSVTGCVIPVYLHGVSVLCTGLTMSFLAFDRFKIINDPLATLKNRTKTKLMLTFVSLWIVSFAVYSFLLVITVDVGTHCILIYRNVDKGTGDRIYHTFKGTVNYFIPIAVSGYFYIRIYLTLKRADFSGTATSGGASAVESASSTHLSNRRKQRLRGALVASLVLFLFAICYLPTTVMSLWRAWDDSFLDTEYRKYHLITGLISRFNVILNPILYTLSGSSFKVKIRQMFSCCVGPSGEVSRSRVSRHNGASALSSKTRETSDYKAEK